MEGTTGWESYPLFGDDSRKTKAIDGLFVVLTLAAMVATLVVTFTQGTITGMHIFAAVAFIMVASPQLVLSFWMRKGQLEPKFRYLIGYMCVSLIFFTICICFYFIRGNGGECNCSNSTQAYEPVTATPIYLPV